MAEENTSVNDENQELQEEEAQKAKHPDAKWYVVHTQSGYENKVKERIFHRVKEANMEELVCDVYVPQQAVTEVKNGKRTTRKERFFPGYVLVEMVMNDAAWGIVKQTPGVSGFIGRHATTSENDVTVIPQPLKKEEVDRMFSDKDAAGKKEDSAVIHIDYEIGEKVKVIEGPFMGLNGVVDHINYDKGKLTVSIEIFGRATPTEIDYLKVQKV